MQCDINSSLKPGISVGNDGQVTSDTESTGELHYPSWLSKDILKTMTLLYAIQVAFFKSSWKKLT